MSKNASHKIALYVRVSTEEQTKNPEGSIKSQEQRLRTHVDFHNQEKHFGDVAAVFVDKAKSGKDTKRPELQRLLQAVRKREVTMVMVTELSRLSRSIRDFCDMWELMRENGCQFQSLREQFDTTTAAGEMVLYTIANIAQFERKQCSERIKANFRARAERGLFNGGSAPLGYTRHPENKGYLIIKEEEAAIVRAAFSTFLEEGTLATAGKALNDRGYRLPKRRECGGDKPRKGYFIVDNLYEMLTNRAYIGLKVYFVDGEEKTSKAVWKPILNENIFEKVQHMLKANYRRKKGNSDKRYPFLLSGRIFCGQCKDRLPGKSAWGNGGKIPYYEHGWAVKRQAFLNKKIFHCKPHRIQAKKVEPLVWEKILELLTDPKVAAGLVENAKVIHERDGNVSETDKLRAKIEGLDEQLEALAEHLAKIPKGVSPAPIFSQMQKLETLKSDAKAELEKFARSGANCDVPVPLKDYQTYLSMIRSVLNLAADSDLKQKIVERLIYKIEVLPKAVNIHYYVGQSHFVALEEGAREQEHPATPQQGPQIKKDRPLYYLDCGSNSLTKNRGAWKPCELSGHAPYLPILLNHFLTRPIENGHLLSVLFVEKQWSARQIAEFTGWSKTSVVEAIAHLGLHRPRKPHIKEPFGWKLVGGELIPHVREQKIVKAIVQLRKKGHSATRIAGFLNEREVPTKNRKRWEHKTVKAILYRENRRISLLALTPS